MDIINHSPYLSGETAHALINGPDPTCATSSEDRYVETGGFLSEETAGDNKARTQIDRAIAAASEGGAQWSQENINDLAEFLTKPAAETSSQ